MIVIESRYRGPATSGNGGYTAGLVATASGLSQPPTGVRAGPKPAVAVSVRLRTPPPLDRPLELAGSGDRWLLRDGEMEIAEAAPSPLQVDPVEPVSYDDAVEAAKSYAGFRRHPFPGCFVCGPDRSPGDGLRLFPGRTAPGRTACAWTPDDSAVIDGVVSAEMVWAALDCPGGWTAEIEGRPMVLGTMTAAVSRPPEPGEPCVVVGALLGVERRRADTASTLYGADGAVLAIASAVWVEIDADAFNRVFAPAG
jgi:hypothetical protein